MENTLKLKQDAGFANKEVTIVGGKVVFDLTHKDGATIMSTDEKAVVIIDLQKIYDMRNATDDEKDYYEKHEVDVAIDELHKRYQPVFVNEVKRLRDQGNIKCMKDLAEAMTRASDYLSRGPIFMP